MYSRAYPHYTAGCYEGQSAFVDAGRDCNVANGIEEGKFAEMGKVGILDRRTA
jgi:hypothetical protein